MIQEGRKTTANSNIETNNILRLQLPNSFENYGTSVVPPPLHVSLGVVNKLVQVLAKVIDVLQENKSETDSPSKQHLTQLLHRMKAGDKKLHR